MDNTVDNAKEMPYNVSNDVDDFVVKMDEQPPINDVNCKHETLIADPEDTLGEAVMHMCANHKCGVGFYIQPAKNKNIT